MRVLVLGATGLLGNAIYRHLSSDDALEIFGTFRAEHNRAAFDAGLRGELVPSGDLTDLASVETLISELSPDVVINCVALNKADWGDFYKMIALFALLPRRLQQVCTSRAARLIHISSDGVFSGARGGYCEGDVTDASDPYGIAKQLGEIDAPNALTLRTSMIGHSLNGETGLVDWFLAQDKCRGFTRAKFSGLPTIELARVIKSVLLDHQQLSGIFHVAAAPISKFDLLRAIARTYRKPIEIAPEDGNAIDRSLNSEKFKATTGYEAPPWPNLIQSMYDDKNQMHG